jgi:acyl-coenzyme A synthetase/AMP-(fatty) acid ligase/acyl carrier protein
VYSILSSTEAGPFLHTVVDDALRTTTGHPPAGRPALGWKVTIVGDDGEQAPDGKSGEIVVASRFIALGYWYGSDLEIRAFPSDPSDPKARVFESGDRGRRRPDGLIEFVGRNDKQIKLHGHRIEPAEVESALTSLREVSDAAVVVRCSKDGVPLSLVAYVVLGPRIRRLLPRHLQSMLTQHLPRYMVPSRIVLLDDLPRLPNFKIDRVRLAQLDATQTIEARDRGDDPLIDRIAGIFEAVIGVTDATPEDTVASIGGDSLQEIHIIAELERCYGVSIPDDLIKERPTISSIASWIAGQIARPNTRAAPR